MNIFLFFIILVVLIVVHEFGHFIVAKRMGIRVDEFGIGFPPRALTMLRKGETIYTLNWLPFGGFVKIFGENPDEESLQGSDKDRSLAHKSKMVQILVLIAGVGFNVLLAWFLFVVVFMVGSLTAIVPGEDTTYITGSELRIVNILPDSPAQMAGLKTGDTILSLISGSDVLNDPTPDSTTAFVAQHAEGFIEMYYKRDGDSGVYTSELTPVTGLIADSPNQPALGVGMSLVGELKLPIHLATWEATLLTGDMLKNISIGLVTFFASAFTLSADLSQITGPIGIVGLVGDAASLGVVSVLMFSAFISLNLAVINVLPIPALDGGRIMFVLIEALKGSPIKPYVGNLLNTIGFAVLIIFMVVVSFNDILRIVG